MNHRVKFKNEGEKKEHYHVQDTSRAGNIKIIFNRNRIVVLYGANYFLVTLMPVLFFMFISKLIIIMMIITDIKTTLTQTYA